MANISIAGLLERRKRVFYGWWIVTAGAILERLAKQIAPAIENARLFQELQASTREIALVDEVAKIITSTLDMTKCTRSSLWS